MDPRFGGASHRGDLGRTLFGIGLLLTIVWVGITLWWFLYVVKLDCLTAGATDSPPGTDCGDARRGAAFMSVAWAFITLLPGILLMLPSRLKRRRRD